MESKETRLITNAERVHEAILNHQTFFPGKRIKRVDLARELNMSYASLASTMQTMSFRDQIFPAEDGIVPFNGKWYKATLVYEKPKRRRRLDITRSVLPDKQWQVSLEYFNYGCAVCRRYEGNIIKGIQRLAQDHWIPDFVGGASDMSNIVPLCHGNYRACNSTKLARDVEEWIFDKFDPDFAEAALERVWNYFQWVKEHYGSK